LELIQDLRKRVIPLTRADDFNRGRVWRSGHAEVSVLVRVIHGFSDRIPEALQKLCDATRISSPQTTVMKLQTYRVEQTVLARHPPLPINSGSSIARDNKARTLPTTARARLLPH